MDDKVRSYLKQNKTHSIFQRCTLKYFQENTIARRLQYSGQSIASMYSSVVKYLATYIEAQSLLPSTMYRNKAQKMLGQEGKGTERRTGIWPQVDAINTIL